jgi:hypothetical protein
MEASSYLHAPAALPPLPIGVGGWVSPSLAQMINNRHQQKAPCCYFTFYKKLPQQFLNTYFSNAYYHTPFKDPKLSVACVDPTSQFCVSSMLLLIDKEIKMKLEGHH